MPTTTVGEAAQAGSSSDAQLGPPTTIEFALGGKRLVRYNRMARGGDADASVLGKGGFGCVYRYAIDASFTPPSSMDLSLSLRSAAARRHASAADSSPSSQHHENGCPSRAPLCEDVAATNPLMKPASLVAVKLCRTPCSGSFDELQKTSLVDKRTRRADMQDDSKTHVRIVRGEGRIFQYLQAAHQASGRSDDPPLVKLLANLSPSGSSRDSQYDNLDVSVDEEDGPPTRLLVFEKLIEIDAERTPHGWIKSSRVWSHERVEKVALEVMQGLQFLHEHNVTHGDLKPSNLMLDPRTGVVKIIDLGASRRFVNLSNKERNNRSAVEEQDRQRLARGLPVARLAPELCEGLGSLTGSPYYMAPEILLQATRYVDISGRARSVLEDYEYDFASFLPREQWSMYHIGLSDLRRGWGIQADIWSWACTVQALLLKTVEEDQRPSSSTISPYDFSFSRHRDEMIDPLHEKSPGVDDVPRFHQWCRVLPLLIVRIALEPVPLIAQADGCSPALRSALKGSLRHQDLRPTAEEVVQMLQACRPTSRGSSALHGGGRTYCTTHASPRRSSGEKGGQQSHYAAPSDQVASPGMLGSELESSRYTTPPLSQGASTVSSAQHTCETAAGMGYREATPVSDRKVRFNTSTADSTFFPSPSAESRVSSEVDGDVVGDAVPQGFELVRPVRVRASPLRGAMRPATANATLETPRSAFRDTHAVHMELIQSTRAAQSHPSTPSSTISEAMRVRPRTETGVTGGDAASANRRGLQMSQGYRAGGQGGQALSKVYQDGLGIRMPVESMRTLRLDTAGHDGQMMVRVSASVPTSPMSHSRGASMPMFASPGGPQSMAMDASSRRMICEDIGGSPRAESRASKTSSLMATLKEKQVRLKQSSRKLMARRGTGTRSVNEDGMGYGHGYGYEYGDGHGHGHGLGKDHREVYRVGSEAAGYHEGERFAMVQSPTSNLAMSSLARRNSSSRQTGTPSRRSATKTGDDHSPSKPLIRRLLTWSMTT